MSELPLYKDPAFSPEERVRDLLPRMTLLEKIRELRLFEKPSRFFDYSAEKPFDPSVMASIMDLGGSMYTTDSAPAGFINDLQDFMLHKTRLGIPMAIHGESLHGGMNENCTVFPNPICMAATFDDALIGEMAVAAGTEIRANGVVETYAPNLDLAQEPRWGRVEENYGEDPYLTARMGVSYVKGIQSTGIASSPKHYVAHGTPQNGINMSAVHCGEREFREYFLYPFEKVFKEAGALSVMPAYSEVDGMPIHASEYYLTDILRNEFGLKGPVISDWNAIYRLYGLHHVAADAAEAGEMALRAGVDVEACAPFGFGDDFVKKAESGEIPMELINRAVSRVLWLKFKLGLFENPYAQTDKAPYCHTEAHLALSQKIAEQGAVLLKNEGNLLPLKKDVAKVALIGPNSDVMQLGDYVLRPASERAVTLKKALEERLGAERVIHARGCNIAFGTEEMKAQAVAAAKEASVAVVVLGDNSSYYNNEFWSDKEDPAVRRNSVICGEGFDVDTLDLPSVQEELLEAVYATGTPVVLVMQSGRPHSINWAVHHVPAILDCFYAGEMGGYAMANLLFGDANPSGRLPWTIPCSVGQIPCYYNHKPSCGARPGYTKAPSDVNHPYVYGEYRPLFEFGFGLSYSSFAYGELTLSKQEVGKNENVSVGLTVENTGAYDGYHSVLLFLRDDVAKVTPIVRRLRGFKKIFLKAGEKATVSFVLGPEDYSYIGLDCKPTIDPGTFTVMIGDLKAQFSVK